MEFEEDFVKDELVEFEIEDRKFKFKPTTAGDENEWLNEYMEVGEEGKPKPNLQKINMCKVRNLIEVPYSRELIRSKISVDKEWKNLTNDEKWKFIQNLKPSMFDKIIKKINDIDAPESEVKKN